MLAQTSVNGINIGLDIITNIRAPSNGRHLFEVELTGKGESGNYLFFLLFKNI